MIAHLSHADVRLFAKSLRLLTGRDVSHSQILEDIAAACGLKADAMMHRLKNEAAVATADGSAKGGLRLDATIAEAISTCLRRHPSAAWMRGSHVFSRVPAHSIQTDPASPRRLVYDEYHFVDESVHHLPQRLLFPRYAAQAFFDQEAQRAVEMSREIPQGRGLGLFAGGTVYFLRNEGLQAKVELTSFRSGQPWVLDGQHFDTDRALFQYIAGRLPRILDGLPFARMDRVAMAALSGADEPCLFHGVGHHRVRGLFELGMVDLPSSK